MQPTDRPCVLTFIEGSLQKQQQRQKESAESKAPLSSLWSSGPGLGTCLLAPVHQPLANIKVTWKVNISILLYSIYSILFIFIFQFLHSFR